MARFALSCLIVGLSTLGVWFIAKKLGLIGSDRSIFRRSEKQEALADLQAQEEIYILNPRIRALQREEFTDKYEHEVLVEKTKKNIEERREAAAKLKAAKKAA